VWAERFDTKRMNDTRYSAFRVPGMPEFTVPPEQTVTSLHCLCRPKDLTSCEREGWAGA